MKYGDMGGEGVTSTWNQEKHRKYPLKRFYIVLFLTLGFGS
jgi:hypothetical protein